MHGLFPQSEEFMFWDPEQIDEYSEWQCFAGFLEKQVNLSNELTSESKCCVSDECTSFDSMPSKEFQ